MKYFFWKRTILITLLICTGGMVFSCRSQKQPKLEAEVELANKSVYVWNRGTQAWAGGIVFLNERSLKIQKPFGTVNPQGFAQLPLREFKQDSKPVSEDSLQVRFVWVEAEGYAPTKFPVE